MVSSSWWPLTTPLTAHPTTPFTRSQEHRAAGLQALGGTKEPNLSQAGLQGWGPHSARWGPCVEESTQPRADSSMC